MRHLIYKHSYPLLMAAILLAVIVNGQRTDNYIHFDKSKIHWLPYHGAIPIDTPRKAPLKFQISNRPFKPANSIYLTSENKVYVSDSTGNISAERDSSGRWIITNGSQSLETFYMLFLKPRVDSFKTKLKAF